MDTPLPPPLSSAAGVFPLRLPPVLSIETTEAFAAEIEALAVPLSGPLGFDASATEIITAPGAQLLLAVDKALTQSGGKLILHSPRADMIDTFRLLGLEAQFNSWSNFNGSYANA